MKFCEDTAMVTGTTLQIVVAYHADNLTLKNGQPFESSVKGQRWRTHGFIEEPEQRSR